MKKVLAVTMLVLGLSGYAISADHPLTLWQTVISSAVVHGADGLIYSSPIDVTNYKAFGYEFIVHGSTHNTVIVSFGYQVTDYNCSKMTVAQSTGTATEDPKPTWTTPTTGGELSASLVDGDDEGANKYYVDAFSPMATQYIRFYVDGSTGCDEKSYVTVKFVGYSEK